MGTKLYVGNLDYQMDSQTLESLFTPHGNVESAEIVADRESGRSKGFGFVQMSTQQEAEAAIAALNGQAHDGRTLAVHVARPKAPRVFGGEGRGGRGSETGFGRSRY
jgi:cold-inducible RNA-binding protein